MPYSNTPQHFCNSPQIEKGGWINGITIIEIGFVDFGITFDSLTNLKDDGDPLVVIGYESSPFCVAKTRIMLAMMNDPVVQAIAPEARSIIQYWNKTKEIPAKEALKFQMEGAMAMGKISTDAMKCCSLTDKSDRIDFSRYTLTKALYEDKTTTFGSTVMNTVNESIGVTQCYSNCFESAPFHIHFDEEAKSGSTVIGRIKSYFEKHMKRYIRHIRKGSLVFISAKNDALLGEMKALKPDDVPWSNVPDYMPPKEFHNIAKQISCEKTIHFMHSCNWTFQTHGTDIYDMYPTRYLHWFSARLVYIEKSHQFFEGFTQQPVYHFRDICSIALVRRFVNKFFQFFFEGESVKCGSNNGKPLKAPFRFSRCVSTAYIVFTYKETGFNFEKHYFPYNFDIDGYNLQ